jgi:hypothetical protein
MRRNPGVGRGQSRFERGDESGSVAIVIGSAGDDRARDVVRVAVERGQPTEHGHGPAIGLERRGEDRLVVAPPDAARRLQQFLGEHGVRQPRGDVERRQQRRRQRDVILGRRQRLSRPVNASDKRFEPVDGRLQLLPVVERGRCAQDRVENCCGDLDAGRCRRSDAVEQLREGSGDARIVAERSRFGQCVEPTSAIAGVLTAELAFDGGAERRFDCVTLARQASERIGANEKPQHDRIGRVRLLVERAARHSFDPRERGGFGRLTQARNYNGEMFAVRYAALIALVVWLCVLLRHLSWVRADTNLTLACGAALIMLLLVLKFVGPPPASFFARLAIVAAMLALAVWNRVGAPPNVATVELALGCVLLGWYARE